MYPGSGRQETYLLGITEIPEFAKEEMGTPDVCIDNQAQQCHLGHWGKEYSIAHLCMGRKHSKDEESPSGLQ